MKKILAALMFSAFAFAFTSPAFAYGTLWCKVDYSGRIKACFKEHYQCDMNGGLGDCVPVDPDRL